MREGFLEDHQYENLRNELPDHQRLILVIGFLQGRDLACKHQRQNRQEIQK